MQTKIKWYYIAIGFFILGWVLSGNYKGQTVRIIETRTDTITEFVKVDSLIYKTTEVLIPSKIDTQAVIRDFYNKRSVDTTIVINEAKIKFTGTLFENKLRDVQFNIQNLRPTQIVQEMKYSLSVGGIIGKEVIAPSASIQYDRHQLGASYNLLNGGLLVNYHFRIWSK